MKNLRNAAAELFRRVRPTDADPYVELLEDRVCHFDEEHHLRKGEFQFASFADVEDRKGNPGQCGTLVMTNLRLMWTSNKSARMNLSIGMACIAEALPLSGEVIHEAPPGEGEFFVKAKLDSTLFQFNFMTLSDPVSAARLSSKFQEILENYRST